MALIKADAAAAKRKTRCVSLRALAPVLCVLGGRCRGKGKGCRAVGKVQAKASIAVLKGRGICAEEAAKCTAAVCCVSLCKRDACAENTHPDNEATQSAAGRICPDGIIDKVRAGGGGAIEVFGDCVALDKTCLKRRLLRARKAKS